MEPQVANASLNYQLKINKNPILGDTKWLSIINLKIKYPLEARQEENGSMRRLGGLAGYGWVRKAAPSRHGNSRYSSGYEHRHRWTSKREVRGREEEESRTVLLVLDATMKILDDGGGGA